MAAGTPDLVTVSLAKKRVYLYFRGSLTRGDAEALREAYRHAITQVVGKARDSSHRAPENDHARFRIGSQCPSRGFAAVALRLARHAASVDRDQISSGSFPFHHLDGCSVQTSRQNVAVCLVRAASHSRYGNSQARHNALSLPLVQSEVQRLRVIARPGYSSPPSGICLFKQKNRISASPF